MSDASSGGYYSRSTTSSTASLASSSVSLILSNSVGATPSGVSSASSSTIVFTSSRLAASSWTFRNSSLCDLMPSPHARAVPRAAAISRPFFLNPSRRTAGWRRRRTLTDRHRRPGHVRSSCPPIAAPIRYGATSRLHSSAAGCADTCAIDAAVTTATMTHTRTDFFTETLQRGSVHTTDLGRLVSGTRATKVHPFCQLKNRPLWSLGNLPGMMSAQARGIPGAAMTPSSFSGA
jgi:hypothetical protein